MDDDTARKLYSKAKAVAARYWFPQEAQDVAQDVLVSYLKNPNSKQTVTQAVIDWARRNGSTTRRGNKRLCLLDANTCVDDEYLLRVAHDAGYFTRSLLNFEEQIKGLASIDRCIAVLRFVWGFEIEEIAYCFGMSASRVSLAIGRIQQSLKEEL